MIEGVPGWVEFVGIVVIWCLVSFPVAVWAGRRLKKRREVEEFADWARNLHENDQRLGLSIEIGDGFIRITSPAEERTIELAPGNAVEIAVGSSKPDPKKDLH